MGRKRDLRKRSDPDSPTRRTGRPSQTIMRWLTVLTIFVVALWVLFAVQLIQLNSSKAARNGSVAERAALNAPSAAKVIDGTSGPWGRLQYVPTVISQPREMVTSVAPLDPTNLQWHFPKVDREGLSALLTKLGFAEPLRQALVSKAQLNHAHDGMTVRPTEKVVLDLSPELRTSLYTVLADYPENEEHVTAFRFPGASPDEWFEGSGLSAATRQIVDPLIYRRGNFLFFADSRLVTHRLPSPQQRWALLKALTRFKTLVVRLKISQETDVESLVHYWGQGGRAKDVRPVLESFFHEKACGQIDVRHLLPELPQRLLYTYKSASELKSSLPPNCHWTSLNFFYEEPQERFAQKGEIDRELVRSYRSVSGTLRLGDIAVLFNKEGRIVHSAVFIADDVFFTKNGHHAAVPWILMSLDLMRECYEAAEFGFYRRKDL